jgi:hypothetical protein
MKAKMIKMHEETVFATHNPTTSILKPHVRISEQQFAARREEAYINKAFSEIDLNKIEQQNNQYKPSGHNRRSGSYDSNVAVNHMKHSVTATTFLSNNNTFNNSAFTNNKTGFSNINKNVNVNSQEIDENNNIQEIDESNNSYSSQGNPDSRKQFYELNGAQLDEINL